MIFRVWAPQWLRVYVDAAVQAEGTELLLRATFFFTCCSLIRHACTIASRIISESIGLRATDALRSDAVAHCLSLDLSYHKERTAGEMISRLDHDLNSISDFFSKFWSGILVSVFALLLALLVIWLELACLGVVLAISTSLSLYGLLKLKDFTVPYLVSEMPAMADHYGTLEEQFTAAEALQANGALGYTRRRFNETLAVWRTTHRNAYLAYNAMWSGMQIAFSINTVIAFAVCYLYWRQGAIEIGTAFMLVAYSEQLRQPLSELRQRFSDLQRADAAMIRLGETLATKSSLGDEGILELGSTAVAVTFDRVQFAYSDEQAVLNELSFHLSAGKTLGLLGRTGSGKSTLVRLLMRFYEPQSGRVLLGETPLHDYTLQSLRRSIAYVSQEVQLFRTSLRDNLTFFDKSISDDDLLHALEILGLQDWLTELPQGLDSVLGSDFGLSAGESQLVALTRAFLKQPVLVILDEASARLDPITERRVSLAMQLLLQGRTGIIIAHRLHTLEGVDKILILERGSIAEFGDYETLKDDPSSLFAMLLKEADEGLLSDISDREVTA
ncbi:MAG: ABC transporter ATP-binding protein/permease [Symbiobacteriaceae bacterium]|nr:ABC transporter ATP-binding protein/permease [Symbiobacteriaceae bacterium]